MRGSNLYKSVLLSFTFMLFFVNGLIAPDAWGQEEGSVKWALGSLGGEVSSPAIGPDGTIFTVTCGDGTLHALNPDGTEKWNFRGGEGPWGWSCSAPAVASNGTIYVGSSGLPVNFLFALNQDGAQKWAFETGEGYDGAVYNPPAIGSDGTIYLISGNRYLHALKPNGIRKWTLELGDLSGSGLPPSPSIGMDGTIYVGGNGILHAIDPVDGTIRWNADTAGGINYPPAIGPDGTIYVGSDPAANFGQLFAINPDGTQKWVFSEMAQLGSSPLVGADGTIYVNSACFAGSILYALSPDGTRKWEFLIGAYTPTSPALGADGTIYVGGNVSSDGGSNWEGYFHAVNPDGTQKWLLKTGEANFWRSSPAISADGTVYVGAVDWNASPGVDNGYLYAIYSSSKGLGSTPWPMLGHDPGHTGNAAERNLNIVPLSPGGPYERQVVAWPPDYYSFRAEAGKSLLVRVVPSENPGSFVVEGHSGKLPPYPGTGLFSSGSQTMLSTYELFIPQTENTVYLFSIFKTASGGSYIVTASYVEGIYIGDVTPREGGNGGLVTLSLKGLNFSEGTQVKLLRAGVPDIAALEVTAYSPAHLYATFDLTGVPVGEYDLWICNAGEDPRLLQRSFTVTASMPGNFYAQAVVPTFVRPTRPYSCLLEYGNNGGSDIPAQLLSIEGKVVVVTIPTTVAEGPSQPMAALEPPFEGMSVPLRLSKSEPFRGGPLQVLAVGMDGPAGTLRPGSSNRIPIHYQVPEGLGGHSMLEFNVRRVGDPAAAIDWGSLEAEIRPVDMEWDAWQVVWSNLKGRLGKTISDYVGRLSGSAAYLSRYRQSAEPIPLSPGVSGQSSDDTFLYDVRKLLLFELDNASAILHPRSVLAADEDVTIASPGLPLTFSRFAPQSIKGRLHKGPLGRGWSHQYEYTVSAGLNGGIVVRDPAGSERIFYSSGDGTYQGGPGDYGSITVVNGIIVMREKDGIIRQFGSDGKLSSVEDANGNKLVLSFAGGRLTEISHSNGDAITITYDGNGLIRQISDPAGSVTSYQYDASGEHLVGVQKPGGITTSYSYNPADGTASQHALTSITFPDGTRQYFAFDALGRLSQEWRDGGSGRISYGYDDQGSVTITDALGHSASIHYGPGGKVLEARDPLGILRKSAFDGKNRTTMFMGQDGKSISLSYDAKGNPSVVKDQLGHLVRMDYEPDRSRLIDLTDSRSNTTHFTYDAKGNLKSITYPDSSVELYDYDTSGKATAHTNRRNDVIQYSYNIRGQITRKVYPDGRIIDYQYDGRGNLTAAVDSLTGGIYLDYDARGFLVRIEYPGGYWFTFEYNNAGRRTKRTGHDGYVLNYRYNENGRLQQLTDGSGAEIVRYGYDLNGNLTEETKGNGTRTAYEYDAAGQLLHLIHYSPGGAVQSRFDYTYDVNGNRTSMRTLDGATLYRYDAVGQLIGVTYPDGREVTYLYDAAGNRTGVTENGVHTSYVSNSMNQYTKVGDAAYTFDADGNMRTKTDSQGTTSYEYDAENRLVRVAAPSGETWQYTYDALGNRSVVDHDGMITLQIHDPAGFIDLAAQYDEGGTLVARYVYGVGLIAMVDGSDEAAYYSFDAMGNTCQLTDNSGNVVNTYGYSPFGVLSEVNEAISNLFRFAGKHGVIGDESGLHYMRMRYYSPELGRYISEDPIRFAGGTNLYSYVSNNPINAVDPTGLIPHYYHYLFQGIANSCGTGGIIAGFLPGGQGLALFLGLVSITASGLDVIFFSDNPWGDAALITLETVSNVPFLQAFLESLYQLDESYPSWPFGDELESWNDAFYNFLDDYLTWVNGGASEIITPGDPNEKTGPPGVGEEHYLTSDEEMAYTIYFENKPTATAPAQEVFIVDELDPDLDWSTFKLGQVSFGKCVVGALAGMKAGKAQVPVEGYTVDVDVQHIPGTNQIKWTIRTIDPLTGELPVDPFAGFLPPEDGTGRGQGYVSFSLKPRSDRPEGTLISNKATIVFDTEAPMNTNEVFNTLSDGDGDNDGMSDAWEMEHFETLARGGSDDFDGDGLADLQEYQNQTNPKDSDSDDDDIPDGYEVAHGLRPLVNDANGDLDGDGFTNLREYQLGTDPNDPKSAPKAPLSDAGPDQLVPGGTLVHLSGENSRDPDGASLTYSWEQVGERTVALSNVTSATPTFTSPEVLSGKGVSLLFKLTVTDETGLTGEDFCIVNVSDSLTSPVAEAGLDRKVLPGEVVVLDGSGSFDPDGEIVSYSWTQILGPPVSLSQSLDPSQVSFTAPALEDRSLIFLLMVEDKDGLRAQDTVIVNLSLPHTPPLSKAGGDQVKASGETVTLDGSGSSGDSLSYLWHQKEGFPVALSNPGSIGSTFIAPSFGEKGEDLLFELTVTDKNGLKAKDETFVSVLGSSEGALKVTITPSELSGARWKLDDGEWMESGETIPHIPSGAHTIHFLPLQGWVEPEAREVEILPGKILDLSGLYLDPLSVPHLILPKAKGAPGSTVSVPVRIESVSGLLSAELHVSYDPDILSLKGVSLGEFSQGLALSSNSDTLGSLLVALAGGEALSGSGEIILIDFLVTGDPGETSPLAFASVALNDGLIPVIAEDGELLVGGLYDLSGKCTYFSNQTRAIPGVSLTLSGGSPPLSFVSGSDGAFSFLDIPYGTYSLIPSKSDGAESGITAMDASLILQKVVGLITLTPHQMIAGDVNGNGAVTAMDASYILQKVVGLISLPFPGSGKVWKFDPVSRDYTNLSSDQVDQDFTGILIGDVNGNWTPPAMSLMAESLPRPSGERLEVRGARHEAVESSSFGAPPVLEGEAFNSSSLSGRALLSLGKTRKLEDGFFEIPLKVRVIKGDVLSGEMTLQYDKKRYEAVSVKAGALAGEGMVIGNIKEAGKIKVSLASATPINGNGEIALITLKKRVEKASKPGLSLKSAVLNDGKIRVR